MGVTEGQPVTDVKAAAVYATTTVIIVITVIVCPRAHGWIRLDFPTIKKALGFSAQYVRASEDPVGSDAEKC